ncbi:serine hydrolase [Facklamia sp. 7083-14-GEN3]|uniref:serine hydrolase n=1 Tax=Facklamia sp. 7083-14-GEN3 TaxID=2973478 RepID=UPI00215BDB84|nr:serine hydrolase [Facklamia sp. 7083-14-GEN3]MCR8969441.1 class A beta-lactamase-related serine hydrolase [Facklamia sp. 7083-14-GEN3]
MNFNKIIIGMVMIGLLSACQTSPSPGDKVSPSNSSNYQTSQEQSLQIQSSSTFEKSVADENEQISSTKEEIRETTLSKTDKLRKAIIKKQNKSDADKEETNENLKVSTIEDPIESTEELKKDKSSMENAEESDEDKTTSASDDETTTETTQEDEDEQQSANLSFSLNYDQYTSIQEVIKDLIDEYGFDSSKLGIAYQNFVNEESYYLNENEARHAASTNKVGTSVLYLDLIEAGVLNWDSQLPATENDIEEGDGRITNSPLRSSYSLEELISNLLVYSDNTAWNILIDYYYKNYGDYRNDLIELSGVNNKPKDLTQKMNYATPNMLIGYLNKIAVDDSYKPIINYMLIAQEGQRFKLYVDDGMATKYGQYGNGYHDTGIYFEDGKPVYSLVLMTNDLGTIDNFMGDLNLRVNEWYHYQQTQ